MTTPTLAVEESRYDRQERTEWWDQSRLADSSVLVVGAGALGNELVKNLSLVGVGTIDVVDMDYIEHSNLSRCVFFRDGDEGRPKAEVLVSRAATLNPDVRLRSYVQPVQHLGIGLVGHYDVVAGALDNRETRLWVGQACRKFGRAWVDGAIEGLQGVARVFGAEGACYECTLGENDRIQMAHRRSCALLTTEEVASGRTPTNASTSSVVAGVEAQEVIKLLVGRPDLVALNGRAWVFAGETMLSYLVEYTEDPNCLSHDLYESWAPEVELKRATTLREVVETASTRLPGVIDAVDLEDDLISIDGCPNCRTDPIVGMRSGLPVGSGQCPSCEAVLSAVSRSSLTLTDHALDSPWLAVGPAHIDVVTLRSGHDRVHIPVRRPEVVDV
jgi:molybdopterin/thiamine biosynthesis adenylyltransferase